MSQAEHTTNGSVSAEISNGVVGIVREFTGRGPTKARTTVTEDLVIVLMGETLLKAEKSLIASGDSDTVLNTRRKFQETMRSDLVTLVEDAVGRNVTAFFSDNTVSPDMAVELFVLEPLPENGIVG